MAAKKKAKSSTSKTKKRATAPKKPTVKKGGGVSKGKAAKRDAPAKARPKNARNPRASVLSYSPPSQLADAVESGLDEQGKRVPSLTEQMAPGNVW